MKNKVDKSANVVIYQDKEGDIKLDVFLENETVWLNQSQMAQLFGKGRTTITEHINNIFREGELSEKVVSRYFRRTTLHGAIKGKTQTKEVKYYNLDVIISVGYRVKSQRGTQFRIWATKRLRDYLVKGFVLNDDRFKSGHSMNYFDELQQRIREIRLSERLFYQKIKDIYTTSIDYDPKNEKTIEFFKIVQNKLIWAISKQTAAELVHDRVDADKPMVGMKSVDKKTPARITKRDTYISKNYLDESELKLLGLIVEQYLAFAQTMATQNTPMYMSDWIDQLDSILRMNKRELLTHAGKISRKQMEQKAGAEYQKFKIRLKEQEKLDSLKELEADLKSLEEGREAV